ncbi:3-oxoacyl-[acyl-carrier-protein] reductase [Magnaporthiopsis poae ATCC 64411]|uniref:3-oxoacyl-[acyl-carrier-protein] reductase n=1 Tax=Magnaporthiopsis poae (strain ATCC 64411 / 73-15) TaxID=644358 RepID=A0A0C4EEH8_MAGP6|nr:3-oxoacyl-[acyl-carrier-protein] reductase [Magnaporthiopsis poae ATCC 64411]
MYVDRPGNTELSAARMEPRDHGAPPQAQGAGRSRRPRRPDGPAQMVAEVAGSTVWSGSGKFELDIVVNNASIAPSLRLIARGSRQRVQRRDPGGRGGVIISSLADRGGIAGLSVYGASKGGLEAATRVWATESVARRARGTTADVVSSGPVDTRLTRQMPEGLVVDLPAGTPLQHRLGSVEEIANTAAWLASPAASSIPGQTISASGVFDDY